MGVCVTVCLHGDFMLNIFINVFLNCMHDSVNIIGLVMYLQVLALHGDEDQCWNILDIQSAMVSHIFSMYTLLLHNSLPLPLLRQQYIES
jgi:hypothetical protein